MKEIVNKILNNEIGIIPHDTVPGIISRMTTKNALKINLIKKRDPKKGFIILIPSLKHIDLLTQSILASTTELIKKHWPGPLTIIFNKNKNICQTISGHAETIALRFPKHELLNNILSSIDEPLISTSANISGELSMSNYVLSNVDFTYGDLTIDSTKEPSTIVDGTTNPFLVIRQGQTKLS